MEVVVEEKTKTKEPKAKGGSKKKPELKADLEQLAYRQLPQNVEAEQNILGAILINNEAINRVAEFLLPEHFYEPVHQRIYEAIANNIEKGLVATPVTLKNFFDKDSSLADVGGAEYLAKLASSPTTIFNVESYGRIIYDLAVRRNLVTIGEDIVNEAFEEKTDEESTKQIERAEQKLFNLASEGLSESGFTAISKSLADAIRRTDLALKRTDKISGVPTKFADLDNLLGGMQDSDLIILAARPSMGKTALAINMAFNACEHLFKKHKDDAVKPSVGFFSLEMSSEQLAARMLSMESAVNAARMRTGSLMDDEFTKIVEANKKMHDMPFFIDDTPALSISAVRTRARRLKRKNNLALLVVDYLQLLRGSSKQAEGSRVQEISEITQGLKAIAKELNIPVVALSQLSRAVEQREDKRPQLSDLRESGSIEQDADVVMFIYREEYYLSRKEPREGTPQYAEWQTESERAANVSEVIIAKHRNGPIGTAKLYFDGNTTKFRDLSDIDVDDQDSPAYV